MSRVNDIVYVFNGGDKFSDTSKIDGEVNMQHWKDAEQKLSYRRRFFGECRGVDNDIQKNLDALKAAILKEFQSWDTIGQVCLLGRSAGCLLALALAAELHVQGVKELTFVGLSDVPMYHDGINPKVPHVGAIKPTNSPIASGAIAPTPKSLSRNIEAVSEVPLAKLDKPITVKPNNKIQLYQTQGNHMKYVKDRKEWIWYADRTMAGEVHGKLDDGWDNQLKVVKGGSWYDDDKDFHVNLNMGQNWKDMCQKAAQEFAKLPAQPLP